MVHRNIISHPNTRKINFIYLIINIFILIIFIILHLQIPMIGITESGGIPQDIQQHTMNNSFHATVKQMRIMKSQFDVSPNILHTPDNNTNTTQQVIIYSELSDGVSKFLGTSNVDTWTDVRNSPLGNQKYDDWTEYTKGILAAYNAKEGDLYVISRSYFPFDTSFLGEQAVIQYASLNIYGVGANESSVCVVGWQDGSDGVDYDDYGFVGTINFGNTSIWRVDTYNEIPLNEHGIKSISTTGFTYLCCREYAHDFLDIHPYGERLDEHRNGHYFADEPGTEKDPYLYIEYAIDSSIQTNKDTQQGQPMSIPILIGILISLSIIIILIIVYEKRKT